MADSESTHLDERRAHEVVELDVNLGCHKSEAGNEANGNCRYEDGRSSAPLSAYITVTDLVKSQRMNVLHGGGMHVIPTSSIIPPLLTRQPEGANIKATAGELDLGCPGSRSRGCRRSARPHGAARDEELRGAAFGGAILKRLCR